MELASGTPTDAGLENGGAPSIRLGDKDLAQKVGGGGGGAIFWDGGSVFDARLNAVSARLGPSRNIVQCFIKQDKTTSTYQLFLRLSSSESLVENGEFLLAARKFRRPTGAHFIISMNPKDMSRGSTAYVGELRSNFLGTKFTIYNSQPPHNGMLSSNCGTSCIGYKQLSPQAYSGSCNVAHIAYQLNVLGMPHPRRMQCTLHTLPASLTKLRGSAPTPTEFTASTLVWGLLSKDKALVLKNKAPRWNEQLQSWCLNFLPLSGTVKSIKNFQLVVPTEAPPMTTQSKHDKVLLQFQKIGKDMFTMDYRYPLCAFQALAICLSSFDTKWLCDYGKQP